MHWSVLLLLIVLLPLRLLSLASRLLISKPNDSSSKSKRWILHLISIPLLLSVTVFALSDLDSPSSNDNDGLIAEIENLKLKVASLESMLEENTDKFNCKIQHLQEKNRQIEEMEHRIQYLQTSVSKLKTPEGSSSVCEKMVVALEEEVRVLWAESRKSNFDYHNLQSKAKEEEEKMEEATLAVAKMENIITEQWIQIRQFEQSLQMMKIMTAKVHKKSTPLVQWQRKVKSTVLKFIKQVRHHYLPEIADLPDAFFLGNYISKSSLSRVFDQLKRTWSAVKEYHQKLQDSIKHSLEMIEFTAPLANQEVVFFLASVLVVMPIMCVVAMFS